jgi:O-phosphoseryl-tRNA(Cys) synthetase
MSEYGNIVYDGKCLYIIRFDEPDAGIGENWYKLKKLKDVKNDYIEMIEILAGSLREAVSQLKHGTIPNDIIRIKIKKTN